MARREWQADAVYEVGEGMIDDLRCCYCGRIFESMIGVVFADYPNHGALRQLACKPCSFSRRLFPIPRMGDGDPLINGDAEHAKEE